MIYNDLLSNSIACTSTSCLGWNNKMEKIKNSVLNQRILKYTYCKFGQLSDRQHDSAAACIMLYKIRPAAILPCSLHATACTTFNTIHSFALTIWGGPPNTDTVQQAQFQSETRNETELLIPSYSQSVATVKR